MNKKGIKFILATLIVALALFVLPDDASAAAKAPKKIKNKTFKVTVVNGDSMKFAWGKAKTGKKVKKSTGYQIKYTVQYKTDDATSFKTSVKNKTLKKGKKKFSHVYKGVRGNTYRVTLNARGYNGKKYGKWAKARTFTVTIPAYTPKYSTFSPSFSQVGENRPLTEDGYLNSQGVAFDTSTGSGYAFAMGSDGNTGVKVIRFTMDGDTINKEKVVLYDSPGENGISGDKTKTYGIGHANDGAVYTKGDNKYLFVAISGGVEKSSTINGKAAKLAYIDLADYNEGFDNIQPVDVKVNKNVRLSAGNLDKCCFSGITYVGEKNGREVMVLKDGRTFYAAYLTFNNDSPVLTIFDSARVSKPMISGKYEAATQDIEYHNGFIYVDYSCKVSGQETKFKVARIKYDDLFRYTYNDLSKMQECELNYTDYEGQKIVKHYPEGIFFKTLEGADNIYISFNRGTDAAEASDIDAVLMSDAQY